MLDARPETTRPATRPWLGTWSARGAEPSSLKRLSEALRDGRATAPHHIEPTGRAPWSGRRGPCQRSEGDEREELRGPVERTAEPNRTANGVGAHLRASRRPNPGRGSGAGPRSGRRSGASGAGGSTGTRLLVAAEDLFLGLAGEQLDELLALDRLALEQDLRDVVELLAVLGEDVARRLVRLLDDAPDLVVDLAGDLVGVVGLGGELAARKGWPWSWPNTRGPELLGHAEAHDHLLGGGGDLLEVVGRAGGDLVEDELLGGAAAQRHRHRVGQLRARGEELVLGGQRDRVAERLAARDHGDLVDRVGVVEVVGHERVAHLVVGGDPALLLGHHAGLLLRARRSRA